MFKLIRSRAALAAFIGLTTVAQASVLDQLRAMQDPSAPRVLEEAPTPSEAPQSAIRLEDMLAPSTSERAIRAVSELPRPFYEAAKASRCPLDGLRHTPGQIFKASSRDRFVYAIIPCGGIAVRSRLYALDRGADRPTLLTLPVLDTGGRFIASDYAGWLEWNSETRTLTALIGSDMIPHSRFRHHYRIEERGGRVQGLAVVLTHIEKMEMGSAGETPWHTVWRAQDWGRVE